MARRIKTNMDKWSKPKSVLGGFYQGDLTYLWIGTPDEKDCLGVISGRKLYRLAKTIVKEFERTK